MARIGRPPGSGTGTNTTAGPCDTCGRDKVWRADSRRAAGGYWQCLHREIGPPRGPRGDTSPRRPGARARRARASSVGTRNWLTDPTLRVCKVDGCHFDAGTCGHRKT